jgi:hypothetical protein
LRDRYRVISVTSPALDLLEGLARGILPILAHQQVKPQVVKRLERLGFQVELKPTLRVAA